MPYYIYTHSDITMYKLLNLLLLKRRKYSIFKYQKTCF